MVLNVNIPLKVCSLEPMGNRGQQTPGITEMPNDQPLTSITTYLFLRTGALGINNLSSAKGV